MYATHVWNIIDKTQHILCHIRQLKTIRKPHQVMHYCRNRKYSYYIIWLTNSNQHYSVLYLLQPDAHSQNTTNYKGCSKHLNFVARVQSSSKKNYNTTIDKTSTKIICPIFRLKYYTPQQQKHIMYIVYTRTRYSLICPYTVYNNYNN